MARDLEAVQKEYAEVVMNFGQKNYHVNILKDEINTLHNRLRDLNKEASLAIKAKEKTGEVTASTQTEANL